MFNRSQAGRIRWGLLALLLVLAAASAGAWLYRDYRAFSDTPLTVGGADVTIDIARGTTFKGIVRHLRSAGLTHASPLYWRALAEQIGVAGRLHAGEYALPPGITPRDLLQRMAAGAVLQHRFTIVDGWTFRQLRLALATEPGLVQTVPGVSDEEIAHRVGIEDGKPEGWFLPETYVWVRGDSDFDLLQRAHKSMLQTLDGLWAARDPAVPLASPYETLILASIIEKETGRGDERPLIAGVFARRMKIGMRLQTDPTVIYGIGDSYDGNIRRRDLETDTPYNTYTRGGLPPTPIALPGRPALEAALHPQPGDALYFVARGDGSHEFSPTLDAHNRAVVKYQLRRKQQ